MHHGMIYKKTMAHEINSHFDRGRRRCLKITAALAAGTIFAPLNAQNNEQNQQKAIKPALVDPLRQEEQEAAAACPMLRAAMELKSQGGFNCAELVLGAGIVRYELPLAARDTAAGFGGGIGQGEVCGLLSGASMVLGLAAMKNNLDRVIAKKQLKAWNDALWTWWRTVAPIDCREIKPHYGKDGFDILLTRICMRLEDIISDQS